MRKELILFIFAGILIASSLFFVSSVEPSYCCEKTTDGLWCQNAPQSSCDTSINSETGDQYGDAPTFCESTNYCSLGTCIDVTEGTCTPNSAKGACEGKGGIFDNRSIDKITQCNQGCCLIGEGASFTTSAQCSRLSTIYGVDINFRKDITDELTCLASATPKEKGACVFESEFESTCRAYTQSECQKAENLIPADVKEDFSFEVSSYDVTFYAGQLCSNPALDSGCSRSSKTTCVEGKDEVYFLDTCGNIANIYDVNKVEDTNYWSYVFDKDESCSVDERGVRNCGNCDYFLGNICSEYNGDNTRPAIGDYVCTDLSCTYDTNGDGKISSSENYAHGERWCLPSPGTSDINSIDNQDIPDASEENLPGSRYYRAYCYNGEVTVEPCSDYRQEVCIENTIEAGNSKVRNAQCVKNVWEDCVVQTDEEECLDTDLRDCKWINSGELQSDLGDDKKDELKSYIKSKAISLNVKTDGTREIVMGSGEGLVGSILSNSFNPERYFQYVCVPKYSPGYEFWNPEVTVSETGEQVSDLCQLASSACLITYEDGITGRVDRTLDDCKENCQCLPDDGPWLAYKQELCLSLGDCGYSVNYLDIEASDDWTDAILRDVVGE